jgi:hypothetical protein
VKGQSIKTRFAKRIVCMGLTTVLAIFSGCRSRSASSEPGVFAEVVLPAKIFADVSQRGGFAQENPATFPELRLYKTQGQLVYVKHDAAKNREALESLPGSLDQFTVKPGSGSFTQLVNAVPQLRDRFKQADPLAKPSVVSILLEECHACSVQEESEKRNQDRLLQEGYNVVILRFTRS